MPKRKYGNMPNMGLFPTIMRMVRRRFSFPYGRTRFGFGRRAGLRGRRGRMLTMRRRRRRRTGSYGNGSHNIQRGWRKLRGPRKEFKYVNYAVGDATNAGRVDCKPLFDNTGSTIDASFWEFHPAQYSSSPVPGTGIDERIGNAVYVQRHFLRLCIRYPRYDPDYSNNWPRIGPICCRIVLIQITQTSPSRASGAFTWDDFFVSRSITSNYKKKVDRPFMYKVWVDKVMQITEGTIHEDRSFNLETPAHQEKWQTPDNANTAVPQTTGRFIWIVAHDSQAIENDATGTNTVFSPELYGNATYVYSDA